MDFNGLKVIFEKKLDQAVGNFHENCSYTAQRGVF
jgi:hypothetical protein